MDYEQKETKVTKVGTRSPFVAFVTFCSRHSVQIGMLFLDHFLIDNSAPYEEEHQIMRRLAGRPLTLASWERLNLPRLTLCKDAMGDRELACISVFGGYDEGREVA